jgi:putative PIN family toxin of toxin-antitoxin system
VARAVLDTNVIVSSVISAHGPSRAIFLAWQARRFELVTSPALIAEVGRALRYERVMQRYRLDDADVRSVLALLWTQGVVLEDPVEVEELVRDPDDNILLALSRDGRAEHLVTGDRLVLELQSYLATKIVTPRQYLDMLDISSAG